MSSPDPITATAAQIVKESRAERDAYIARCKTMTPQAFLAEPASRRARLSVQQQIDIINTILGRNAPQNTAPAHAARISGPSLHGRSFSASLRSRWKKLGETKQALLVGSVAALAMPVLLRIVEAILAMAPAVNGLPSFPAL